RDDLLASRRRRRRASAGRYVPGMPHARAAAALQPHPAQRAGDPVSELPAHALLAAGGRGGQRVSNAGACCAPEEVEQPLADEAGGKSGLYRAGWPLTAAPGNRGKVPQRGDRPGLGARSKGERAREEVARSVREDGRSVNPTPSKTA